MSKSSKIMIFFLVILTGISMYMLYVRSYVTEDFEIVSEETALISE